MSGADDPVFSLALMFDVEVQHVRATIRAARRANPAEPDVLAAAARMLRQELQDRALIDARRSVGIPPGTRQSIRYDR